MSAAATWLEERLQAALALHQAGQLAEAQERYEQILAREPAHPDAINLLGAIAIQVGDADRAVELYGRSIAIDPSNFVAWCNTGYALKSLKRWHEALAHYDQALGLRNDVAEVHVHRGDILCELDRLEAALSSYQRATQIDPANPEPHLHGGNVLVRLKRFDEALQSFDRAIALADDYAEAHLCRGGLLAMLGRFDEALVTLNGVIALSPDMPEAYSDRGNVYKEMRQIEAALSDYSRAMALRHDFAAARFNRALLLLLRADLNEGWKEYEWRRETPGTAAFRQKRDFREPVWVGEQPLAGKTILLYGEQGLGDTLQFCRYVRDVAALGARVVLEVQGPLVPLLLRLEGVSLVLAAGDALPAFDFHCSLLSLPLAFRTRLDSIPSPQRYLTADAGQVARWHARLGPKARPRVGLVWRGNPAHGNNHNRNLPLADLFEYLPSGPQYVSLQKERDPDDEAVLQAWPELMQCCEELHDFAETAALCECMDMVISVDTSIAHLSGALGKETLIVLPWVPDWRWMLDRDDSPWYEAVRLYRQQRRGDWGGVLEQIGAELVRRFELCPAQHIVVVDRRTEDIQSRFRKAVALHESGDVAQARSIYEEILLIHPQHTDAINLLGAIALQKQDVGRAAALFARALEIDPAHVAALCNSGLALAQLGQIPAALARYEQAVALDPAVAELHLRRGRLLQSLKNFETALASYRKAIEIDPEYAEAYLGCAHVLRQLDQKHQALADCDHAISLVDDYEEAYVLRAVLRNELGRPADALADYDRAIELASDKPVFYFNRGTVLINMQRFADALSDYDRALTMKPDYAESYCNRGVALHGLGRYGPALASYQQAIALRPDYADAFCNRGNTLAELKQYELSIASYDSAIGFKPDYPEAYMNRGMALAAMKRFEEALASYDQAIALRADYAEAYCRRGIALTVLRQFETALESYEQAIALKPDYPEAYSNRGMVLTELERFDAALESFDQAIAMRPRYPDARFNRAMLQLLRGDFEQGWPGYECRRDVREYMRRFMAVDRGFEEPLWLGREPLTGRTILLYSEQGLGDTLQFCRYVERVEALGAAVIVEVQRPLARLLACLRGAQRVIAKGDPLPPFDYQCPLLSLPLAFETRLQTIPGGHRYLSCETTKVTEWSARLGPKTRPRIGLVWRGNPNHRNDLSRSIALTTLIEHLPSSGFQYVSLQKDVAETDRPVLERSGSAILDVSQELVDFTDTAALCECMDVVISVDTSVAHLSGALGRTTWILLPVVPDWRWLLNREDCMWYPSVKLYRQQTRGDWSSVLARVSDDLVRAFD